MNSEQLLEKLSLHCETLRTFLQQQTIALRDLSRRLVQILQQLRKNIEVRDSEFATDFNTYVQTLREKLDRIEPAWTELRAQIRQIPDKQWNGELALPAKGLNSRAKTLSVTCDEFTTEYDFFAKHYKNFTAAKLNMFLLTSCQSDIDNLTGKVLFLAREIARKTEQNREPSHER